MNPPLISAVMLVKNEEKNISFCIESVKSWCNEIIIVDMESTDRTVEIAKRYTDCIFSHPQVQNFDSARSFADQKATGNWILMIDADELVPVDLSKKLISIAEHDTADVVYIPFKTFIFQSWVKMYWWPDYHPRFYKNGALSYPGKVHAYTQVLPDKKQIHLPAIESLAIHHFNYRDAFHFIEKLNRYTTVEAHNLNNEKVNFSLFRLFHSSTKTFLQYYVKQKGYKEGHRGFFLSLLMGFYRIITHLKLWEFKEYQKCNDFDYNLRKEQILKGYSDKQT